MLQDIDHMEACWFFYVRVGTFDQLEQSKICMLAVTIWGIAMVSMQHVLI